VKSSKSIVPESKEEEDCGATFYLNRESTSVLKPKDTIPFEEEKKE